MLSRTLLGLWAAAGAATGASLQRVADFGSNPTNIVMQIYVPEKLAEKPAVIVAMHPCGGTAQMFYAMTKLPSFADQLGFILIYPSTPHMSNCWDVQNVDSLTHNQGGDALSIVNMVNHTLETYGADPARVFAMGSSSGAMMTNVLAGSYPNVFEAGAAFSGIGFACASGQGQATPMAPNQTCAQGQIVHTNDEWGNFVRNAYPNYEGRRTRMMIWHGMADFLVRVECAHQALRQWANVMGLEITKNNTGVPSAAYTQVVYGDGTKLQGFLGTGVGHTAPVNEEYILRFFGLLE